MGRLASQAKGMYYPTPHSVIDLILDQIKVTDWGCGYNPTRILDPCIGDGSPAFKLSEALGGSLYGIELNQERAEHATVYGKVLCGSYHQIDTNLMFDILFLNPPYEWGAKEDEDSVSERQEIQFLQETMRYLSTPGLLIYIVPEFILSRDSFKSIMTKNFSNIHYLRFPEGEYEAFKQVVVLATRSSSRYSLKSTLPNTVSVLGEVPVLTYAINTRNHVISDQSKVRFKLRQLNPLDLVPEFGQGAYALASYKTLLGIRDNLHRQPLVAPREGHQAMMLAAGALNGVDLDGVLLKGLSKKIQVASIEVRDEEEYEVITERVVTHLSTLDLKTGEFETWRADQDVPRTHKWFKKYRDEIAAAIRDYHQPLFDGSYRDEDFATLRAPGILPGREKPEILPIQKQTAAAICFNWNLGDKDTKLSGEQGVGKTTIAISAQVLAGAERVVVVCPPHLVKEKWAREVNIITQNPKAAHVGRTLSDVDAFFNDPISPLEINPIRFLIISKERAKLGAKWEHRYEKKKRYAFFEVEDVQHPDYDWLKYRGTPPKKKIRKITDMAVCPSCGHSMNLDYFPKTRQMKCPNIMKDDDGNETPCAEPLWQSVPISDKGTTRWPLASYINLKYKRRYSLIIDECHVMGNSKTDQSQAIQELCSGARNILTMTGTIYDGKSSKFFNYLYTCDPDFRQLWKFNEAARFVEEHGFLQKKMKIEEKTSIYGYNRGKVTVKELPGVDPRMVLELLKDTIFLKIHDLGENLPPYEEKVILVEHDPEVKHAVNKMAEEVIRVIRDYPKVLGQYLMACLGYPDCPEQEEKIIAVDDDGNETLIAEAPAFHREFWPKDEKLLKLLLREKAKGNKAIVFCTQNKRRDARRRLVPYLKKHGLRVQTLDANVSTDKRATWIKKNEPNFDVLLTNGKLVETGLDLLWAPIIVQYGIEYSINTLRQSHRRSWRLGQTKPVTVYFFAYASTIQQQAMKLIAMKMRAAELLDGDDLGGLAQTDDHGQDFFLELAQKVVRNEL